MALEQKVGLIYIFIYIQPPEDESWLVVQSFLLFTISAKQSLVYTALHWLASVVAPDQPRVAPSHDCDFNSDVIP